MARSDTLRSAIEFIRASIIKELKDQGHVASGKLIDIDITYSDLNPMFSASIMMEDYADKVDAGGYKTASFSVMYKWAKFKEPSYTQSELVTFAIGASNKTAPSKGAYHYTKNGRRTEWRKYAIEQNVDEMELKMNLGGLIDTVISRFCKRYKG